MHCGILNATFTQEIRKSLTVADQRSELSEPVPLSSNKNHCSNKDFTLLSYSNTCGLSSLCLTLFVLYLTAFVDCLS